MLREETCYQGTYNFKGAGIEVKDMYFFMWNVNWFLKFNNCERSLVYDFYVCFSSKQVFTIYINTY